jgi:hypothetical protein
VAQALAHELLQHTPPTQLPLSHWSASVHEVPFTLFPVQIADAHVPLEHWSASVHGAPCGSLGVQPASPPQ